ncbi:YciI family protein [Thermocatellispora tengchongensis]|nr:YciI family protein [Thermocatellispora tengchongensis]
MILSYGSQRDYDAMSETGASAQDVAAIGDFLAKFTAELAESGELVETQGLTAPVLARRVRLRDGAQVVTDGPFAETEEVLAGYWIVECDGIDRATEIAARLNECPGPQPAAGTVIRPIADWAEDVEH